MIPRRFTEKSLDCLAIILVLPIIVFGLIVTSIAMFVQWALDRVMA